MEFGAFCLATFSTKAASNCNSPSRASSGARFFAISVASATLVLSGETAEPIVENESKATLGSMPKVFAVAALTTAISPIACASVVILIATSLKR